MFIQFSETLYAYNLIVELDQKGKLNEYYNAEQETLEHFRYREPFLRCTKKAFISIVSKEMVERVAQTNKTLTRDMINKKLKRRRSQSKIFRYPRTLGKLHGQTPFPTRNRLSARSDKRDCVHAQLFQPNMGKRFEGKNDKRR